MHNGVCRESSSEKIVIYHKKELKVSDGQSIYDQLDLKSTLATKKRIGKDKSCEYFCT